MGIVFRQSIKTTLVTFTGAALGAAIILASTSILTQAQYGLITNITYIAAIIQLVILLGTSNLVAVYTQRYEPGDIRRKALISISLGTTILLGLIFSIAFILLKDSIIPAYAEKDQDLVSKYYNYIPLVVWFMAVITMFDSYLIANVKIAVCAFSREVVLRVVNISLLLLILTGTIGFHQYVIGNVLMYLVPIMLLFYFSSKTKGFGFTSNLKVFSLREYKDMLHFSWYHLLTSSMLTLLNFIDTLMLAPLDASGMNASAIYAVAAYASSFMFMPYRAMANSTTPVLNQAYIDKDMNKVADLFKRAGINILIAGTGMFIVIGANLDNAVAILKDAYEPVKYLTLILMLGKLADMASGVNNELLSITKYYKFNYRISVLLLISVVILDYVFIPVYGVYGAAWVSAGTLIVFNIIKTIFLYRKFKLHPFSNRSWMVLAAGAVAMLFGYAWPYILNPYIDTIIRSIVILLTYTSLLIWLKPSADMVSFIESIKKNKRLF